MALRPSRGFNRSTISDQKRLVRGEQLLAARARLRCRDAIHNAKWKVLILAGPEPSEEINAIRELMPRAWIVAVDIDRSCVAAAKAAGADVAAMLDLKALHCERSGYSTCTRAPLWLDELGAPFDIISLDFCGVANKQLYKTIGAYIKLPAIASRGVLLVSFSYGRDVLELFQIKAQRVPEAMELLHEAGMPENIAARVLYLFPPGRLGSNGTGRLGGVKSVMSYRGRQMPMVSVMWSRGDGELSYVGVEPGDLELAILSPPNPAALYAVPEVRLKALRRSAAAQKAARTLAIRRAAVDEEKPI